VRDHRCNASLLFHEACDEESCFLAAWAKAGKGEKTCQGRFAKSTGKSGAQCAIRQVGVGMAGSLQDDALIPSNPTGETSCA